jgi:hypothetical protein
MVHAPVGTSWLVSAANVDDAPQMVKTTKSMLKRIVLLLHRSLRIP